MCVAIAGLKYSKVMTCILMVSTGGTVQNVKPYLFGRNLEQSCGYGLYILYNPDGFLVITKAWNTRCVHVPKIQQQFILYTVTCVVCLIYMCYYIRVIPNQYI